MDLDASFRRILPPEAKIHAFLRDLTAIGPRLMGTAGEREAQAFLGTFLESRGLKVSFQEFDVETYRRGVTDAVLLGPDGREPLEAMAVECSPSTPGRVRLELVHAGEGRPGDVEGILGRVRGRAVYASKASSSGYLRAARAGAAAWLEACSPAGDALRMAFMPPDREGVTCPKVKLKASSGGKVQAALSRGGRASIDLNVEGETEASRSGNLEGTLPGREPLPALLVGAHVDTFALAPGAVDNGTGVAAACLLAEAFAALAPLRRAVRFLLFTGEEDDKRGSREYVRARLPGTPPAGAYFNFDVPLGGPLLLHVMAGEGDDLGFWERLGGFLGDPFRFQRNMRRSSDHYSFYRAGVPCLMMRAVPGNEAEDPAPLLHTVHDTLDRVDVSALRRSIGLSGRILLALAGAEILPFAPFAPKPDEARFYPDPG